MFKDKKTLWIVVVVVAVVASLTTVALLLLRAKNRKKQLAENGEETEGCTCVSIDCEAEDACEEAPVAEEQPEE